VGRTRIDCLRTQEGRHVHGARPGIDQHLGDLDIPVCVDTTYKAGFAVEESGATRREAPSR